MNGDGWLLALAIDDVLHHRIAFGCTLQDLALNAGCFGAGVVIGWWLCQRRRPRPRRA